MILDFKDTFRNFIKNVIREEIQNYLNLNKELNHAIFVKTLKDTVNRTDWEQFFYIASKVKYEVALNIEFVSSFGTSPSKTMTFDTLHDFYMFLREEDIATAFGSTIPDFELINGIKKMYLRLRYSMHGERESHSIAIIPYSSSNVYDFSILNQFKDDVLERLEKFPELII